MAKNSSDFQWSTSTSVEQYGWGIVHTAKWCHYRKGKKCTVPFPKGELCTIENCPMRPQDFAEMFPEDYQELDRQNAALTADLAAVEAERDAAVERGERLAEALAEAINCSPGAFWVGQAKAALAAVEGQSTTAQDNIRRMPESMSMGQTKWEDET